MIIDSHAHYDDEAFEEDREELLLSLKKNRIANVVNVSASLQGVDNTLELVEQYDFIYGALGVHPNEVAELCEKDMEDIRKKCSHDRIVAIGEIGLDYYWPEPDHEIQKKWFRRQMDLCRETNLPVIIHSREACKDTLDILREYPDVSGIIHCYSYTREAARDYLEMGYLFGIGGVVTFQNAKKLKEAVQYIPMDRIVLETDAPYLAPVPFRGKRNSSLYIPYMIAEIARCKGISPEEVERIAWENTCRVFRITPEKAANTI